ncbi:MAG: hypothetical protein IKS30_03125 [Treponema sp.]|jgi:hypothetical protein|nr:hypothetical protein [Treponema sp.]MBR4449171.1 hypothetical protein [Treponema sp.]MCR5172326.1 hypothetical protein [Treponema sp.]HAC32170.1 hypothetical protein [Treponema sp.]
MTSISKSDGVVYSDRVLELRQKIHDVEYMDFAVQRIAQVLSRKLVEDSDRIYAGRKNEPK